MAEGTGDTHIRFAALNLQYYPEDRVDLLINEMRAATPNGYRMDRWLGTIPPE